MSIFLSIILLVKMYTRNCHRKIYKINGIFYVTTQLVASNLAMSKLATGAETNFVTLYCIATKMFHVSYFNPYSINIFVIIRIIYFNKQHYISQVGCT